MMNKGSKSQNKRKIEKVEDCPFILFRTMTIPEITKGFIYYSIHPMRNKRENVHVYTIMIFLYFIYGKMMANYI